MDYQDDCIVCGFKCEKVCPVSRGTGKFHLSRFLHAYLVDGFAISWPCASCHGCDAVCPADHSPRELIVEALNGYLRTNENMLTDYYEEFIERGRVGISAVDLDEIEFLRSPLVRIPALDAWERVVIFPGCLVSSKYPRLVLETYHLLNALGIPAEKLVVDDESCCGTFLQQVDPREFEGNAQAILAQCASRDGKTLIITLCGSCTSSLRRAHDALIEGAVGKGLTNTQIMHLFQFIGQEHVRSALLERLAPVGGGSRVYLQYPCQAETSTIERKASRKAVESVIEAMGYQPVQVANDLGCCGASMLDTHPDFAIEFGIARYGNIVVNDVPRAIMIGCGNCHRMFVDFKPAMEVEGDDPIAPDLPVVFLLDTLVDSLLGTPVPRDG